MDLKDYYSILELPPSASADDVKKAYRRLALVYHPDKTGDDPYARAQFNAVKEAYEVLSNPQRRDTYLQERWYARSQGIAATMTPLTPSSFLQRVIAYERIIYQADVHRAGYASHAAALQQLFSDSTIQELLLFKDKDAVNNILQGGVRIAEQLPHPYTAPFILQLKKLDQEGSRAKELNLLVKKSRRTHQTGKLMPWLAALLAILLCILIYLAA